MVGVGASAGGLEALEELFRNMPADTGMAFIVVTHLHPGHRSLLPELLSKITDLPVVAAATGLEVKADHIYVIDQGQIVQSGDHGSLLEDSEGVYKKFWHLQVIE